MLYRPQSRFRQYGSPHHVDIDHALENSLLLMKDFLQLAPVRELSIAEEPASYLVIPTLRMFHPEFLDGWLEPCSMTPRDATLRYSSWEGTQRSRFPIGLKNKTSWGQLELLAAPFGLSTWRDVCTNRSIILFVDNDSASC